MIDHTAFFGDASHTFRLTDPMVTELERLTGTGIGSLFTRMTRADFRLNDLAEVIRLGLIGAGTSPEDAARLVQTYAHHRPIGEILPLVLSILDARWSGTEAAA
ncbi:MAG: gene transfer agent family protein [Hyphomonas sp.]